MDADEFDSIIAINTKGPLFLTEGLNFASEARIVNVGSESGRYYSAPGIFYSISKSALLMVNKAMNAHLKKNKVSACVVHPGAVDTALLRTNPEAVKLFDGITLTPRASSFFLVWLLTVPVAEFRAKYWNIYTEEDYPRWVPHGVAPPVDPLPHLTKL
jgi:NAD(P)-dependent dehydrogenase (short-subunit alcohol dehydrogenase family)